MSDAQQNNPIDELWAKWDALYQKHGRPGPAKIAHWTSIPGNAPKRLKESTIRGWISPPKLGKPPRTTVPAWQDEFRVLLMYLDSLPPPPGQPSGATPEADKPLWLDAWHQANNYKKNGEPDRGDGPSPPDSEPTPAQRLWRLFGEMERKKLVAITALLAVVAGGVIFWLLNRSGESQQPSAAGMLETPARHFPSSETTSSPQSGSTAVQLCAYVTTEKPAPVYPQPDMHSEPVKYKYKTNRIVILNQPHPEGWLVVKTPQNPPGANWMRATALTTPTPCTSPPPGER
ncbi:hypothetical protein AB0C28_55650 [Nonomuraea sp. NPDC048892]|uniref:hypothetical protein n=1 Tax=Nonomuraea sp. NPDC048892 TaxID=3154624 RepID=UPI0033EFC1F5